MYTAASKRGCGVHSVKVSGNTNIIVMALGPPGLFLLLLYISYYVQTQKAKGPGREVR